MPRRLPERETPVRAAARREPQAIAQPGEQPRRRVASLLSDLRISEAVLRDGLVRGPVGQNTIERGRRHASFALLLYTLLAVAAVWDPRLATSVMSLTWLFWLVTSIQLKHRELEIVCNREDR